MNYNFTKSVLHKINICNNILSKYNNYLFTSSDLIKFDDTIFKPSYCDFRLIKNNDSIHFSLTEKEINVSIGIFDECIIFKNIELDEIKNMEIIEAIFNGFVNLIVLEDNSIILSIHNYLGEEIYKISRKKSFFFNKSNIKKSQLFLPI